MPYSYFTLGQAKTLLAQRLYDAGMEFFVAAELGAYILESLQTFNALGNFYRQEFNFNTTANVTWYDLSDAAAVPSTLRPISETDQTILNAIEYHLLEPQTASYPLAWTGSLQFNLGDILNAIQQVRDQVLAETNCTVRRTVLPAIPGRTFLPERMMTPRRIVWLPTSGFGYSANMLMPSDLWAQQSFEAGFPQAQPNMPMTYRMSTEPPLGFDVDVQPSIPGDYEVLAVSSGADLSLTASSVLPVPNDWCWVIKWGALAQLFGRDSVSSDPFRAQYCMARYLQGIAAMRSAPALVGARINDVPVVVTAVTAGDFYDANWQAQAAGAPRAIYYAGLNLVGLGPMPSSNGYSITANVVRNMVLPSTDNDYLQVGRDDVAAILDESQHLAMVKVGGAEFGMTFGLHANFLRRCTLYNSKLSALSLYLEFLDGQGQRDDKLHPAFQGVSPETVKS